MGFLERAVRRGVSRAIGDAVEKSVRNTVTPKIEEAAANTVNQAADAFNKAAGIPDQPAESQINHQQATQAAETLSGLFGGFAGAATNFANEAAKNMKICAACGEAASASTVFCPSCGAKLPENTIAQECVCTSCGAQNKVGTKFCADCGAKLPAAIAQEEAEKAKNDEVLREWDELIPNYPKWCFGGTDYCLEEYGTDDQGRPYYYFTVSNTTPSALRQYKDLLRQNGFRTPPGYSSDEELYQVINGVSYAFNSTDAFSSDPGCMSVAFHIREFKEKEPEKKKSAFDLLDLFK